jgi:hypothetical protein
MQRNSINEATNWNNGSLKDGNQFETAYNVAEVGILVVVRTA